MTREAGSSLAIEDVEGHSPSTPWRREEVDKVVATLAAVADTPAPWVDLVFLLTAVGHSFDHLDEILAAAGAPVEGVDAVLCAFAGMLAEHCRRPLSRACRRSARSSARMLVARPNGSPGAPGGAVQFGRWGRRLVGCHIACGRVRSRAPIPSTYIT